MAGHALQEEQPRLLVQDGVRGSAGVACDILLDVAPKDVLDMLLLELALHHELIVAINGTSRSQLSKQEC